MEKKSFGRPDSPAHLVCEQHSGTKYQIREKNNFVLTNLYSAGGTEIMMKDNNFSLYFESTRQ